MTIAFAALAQALFTAMGILMYKENGDAGHIVGMTVAGALLAALILLTSRF